MNKQEAGIGWAARLPFYYGWVILAASALSEMVATGIVSYAAPLFVLPVQAEFHLSRANASSAVPILLIGGVLFVPFAGRILDSYPIRWVMTVGVAAMCVALVIIATANSLLAIALALLLPAAVGFVLVGTLTTATLASRWFWKRRGLALGIAAVATSGGGFTVAPLVNVAILKFGWRDALLYEAAAFALVILPLTFLLLRSAPRQVGLEQHREVQGQPEAPPAAPVTGNRILGELQRWKSVLGRVAFWAPTLALAETSGLSQGIVISAVPYGVQMHLLTPATAAMPAAAFSSAALLSKIFVGVIADYVDARLLLLLSAVAMAGALGLLASGPDYSLLLGACALAGVALGGALPSSAALIAGRFGASRFGATMGWSYVFTGIVTIAASRIAGASFDQTGSYHQAFVIFLVACLMMSAIGAITELARTKSA